MSTATVANRLVSLCREGKFEEAQRELYAKDAISIEPQEMSNGPMGNVKGLKAILEKGQHWAESVEAVHNNEISDPVVADGWFSVAMHVDATMKGRGRADMREICVYHVKNDKIVQEQFFYDVH
ncbi:nuclear transport factor 2 family protein [Dyella psychrodurans]|uniref:Nuclear transport factor 2 family protein n=1 Tax=Dyella psychrodurans TaxID=1927960 RepID=A0A370X783_9GAMM|nr:nuclear transport factor 2 family protein [Dyella psychrodurans]RDS84130.1 nuclear transport factor 2 family protein [Dyella psychrodurans]